MKKKISAILLVVLLVMPVLSACVNRQNDSNDRDNNGEIITADNLETTLELHHIGQKTGKYTGEMKDDLPNGKGSFETQTEYGNTVIYDGEWVNGQLEGLCTVTWPGDKVMSVEGTFVDSEIVNGKEIYDGVKIYEGEWKDLAHHGQGTFYNAAGDVVYSGTFNDGYPGDEDKFMAGAKEVSYDALLSDPQHYMYDIIKVQGKIVYVWEDEDYCEYLISTDESDEKTVYITYFRRSDDERHIQEGESLTVYGISEGLYTYETTEDTLATTPNMTMFFYE